MKKRKKGSRNWGQCPACKEYDVLNRHHYLPKRFFGDNPFFIRICDTCHQAVEELIPETRRLPAVEYFEISYYFIFRQTPKTYFGGRGGSNWPEDYLNDVYP